MNKPPQLSSLSNKRIPTILGLVILVVALAVGVFFFQDGLGVFAPRATAETTPDQVKITNVSHEKFTISFLTQAETVGFIRYGTEPNRLNQTAADDRDSLTGTTGEYKMHHITARSLQPNTRYYFVLGTGSGALFDNEGEPFEIVTARRSGSPTAAQTIFGSVTNESGAPAEGAVVYVSIEGAGQMSSLVKNSGGWAIPLSDARTPDGSAYAPINEETQLQFTVQGPNASQIARGTAAVGEYEGGQIPPLTYGQTAIIAEASESPSPSPSPTTEVVQPTPELTAQQIAPPASEAGSFSGVTGQDATASATASNSGLLADASASGSATPKPEVTELDLTKEETQTLTTGKPKISGKAAPNVVITVEVNSETKIVQQLVANEDGSFSLDISQLEEELEPGEHTVTYSYTDPNTGELVTKTETFYVEPQNESVTIASATPSPSPSATPFGTDNPYPIDGATTSAQTIDDDATGSGTATGSGRSSMVSTDSGTLPKSGSLGTTMALVFGGLFFLISGGWSYWISKTSTEE